MFGIKKVKAFTILEVLIASSMSVIFGFIVISSIITITNLSTNLYKESSTQQSARLVLDLTTRSIRNAVPLYSCSDSPIPNKLGACKILKLTPPEASSAFIKATSDEAFFFSYGARASTTSSDVPDLIQINLVAPNTNNAPTSFQVNDNYKICVTVYKPNNNNPFTAWRNTSNNPISASDLNGVGYTGSKPIGADPAGISRICAGPIGYDPSGTVKTLRYRTSSNCYYGEAGCSAIESIKQVELNLVLSYTTTNKVRLVRPLQAFINVGSANLGGA